MLNAYTIFKSIHVLGVVIWVGSDVAIHVFALRAVKAGPTFAGYFAKEAAWYAMFINTIASLVVLIAGFATLSKLPGYSLSTLWVSIGFVVWLASFLTGVFYLGPTSGKLGKSIDEAGTMGAPEQAILDKVLLVSRIDMLLLMLVVVDMIVKPT